VQGAWKIVRRHGTAILQIDPFAPLAAPDRDALIEEGERLLAFAAAGTRVHDITVAPMEWAASACTE
jgi:hypothetical protein